MALVDATYNIYSCVRYGSWLGKDISDIVPQLGHEPRYGFENKSRVIRLSQSNIEVKDRTDSIRSKHSCTRVLEGRHKCGLGP
jgi:hypothetical protein